MNQIKSTLCVLLASIAMFCLASKPVYQITLDTFDSHSDVGKDYVDPGTLRIVRKGRNNFVLSGNYTLFKNMGNEVIIKVTVSRKALNGKMVKTFASANPVCEQIQNDDQYYPRFEPISNLPMPAPCPFPKGEYYITNFKVDDDFMPAILPLGEYLVEVDMVMDGVVLFGYNVHATIS